MSKLIEILYTRFQNPLNAEQFRNYTNRLPISLKKKTFRYRNWKDKHSHLFGKLLLSESLRNIDEKKITLDDLKYTEFDRPYFDSNIDFNISHSADYVICAIAREVHIGVDIEKKKEIKIDNFRNQMTKNQWNEITSSLDSNLLFLKYWTMKESMAKANGMGLNIKFANISFEQNIAKYNKEIWYLSELKIDSDYVAFIASNIKCIEFYMGIHSQIF